MRVIGSIAEQSAAERFVDYLLTLEIEAQAEEQAQGWGIWVEHDDHLERAQRELEQFRGNPDDPRYDAGQTAQRLRVEQEKREQRLRRRHIDVRTRWHIAGHGAMPLTVVLIAACLLVALASNLGEKDEPVLNRLYFASFEGWMAGAMTFDWGEADLDPMGVAVPADVDDGEDFLLWPVMPVEDRPSLREAVQWRWNGLAEIRGGQVWRLVTPMFIHFGVLHLVFNLFWLHNFGGAIESRKGWPKLLAMVLGISLVANVVQYGWTGFPLFGGMSGVVYGLFGYLWVKSVLQPQEQFAMPQQTVIILVAWMFICMTGFIGAIANAAHFGGLAAGAGLAGAAYVWVRVGRWWRVREFGGSV